MNKRVLKTAIRGAEKAAAEVSYIDLRDYPTPIYNPDDEEENAMDENALRFQGLLAQHDGLLVPPGIIRLTSRVAEKRN